MTHQFLKSHFAGQLLRSDVMANGKMVGSACGNALSSVYRICSIYGIYIYGIYQAAAGALSGAREARMICP